MAKKIKNEKIKLILFYCFIFLLFKCFDRWALLAFIINLFYSFLSVLMLWLFGHILLLMKIHMYSLYILSSPKEKIIYIYNHLFLFLFHFCIYSTKCCKTNMFWRYEATYSIIRFYIQNIWSSPSTLIKWLSWVILFDFRSWKYVLNENRHYGQILRDYASRDLITPSYRLRETRINL